MSRKDLYKSKLWKQLTHRIWIKQHCLCNRCGKPVYVSGISNPNISKENRLKGIVHHKIYLTDENYTDNYIAINEDNLEGICINCHNKEHFSSEVLKNDVMFDCYGNLIKK